MASRFSALPNYNYQEAPLDLLLKAGMAKDENIQQGVDKTQNMINTIGGIETYGVLDTARKQIKLGELQKNIQALGGKDFTDPNTQNQINGLIQGFANDPEITQWISHAQNAKASNDFMDEQNKDQSYYDNNWKEYHDIEDAYNSQDPNTTVSKSPFTTPFYGLDYQDIGKETRDIVGAVGIGTLQPLTFDPSTGSYYTIEGKPAKNITDAVYSQLSDKSKKQIANDYNASPELQDTFVDVGAYFTSIAKDAATSYSVPKMDFTSPKNVGTSGGSSGGEGNGGTGATSGITSPYVILADDKSTTLPADAFTPFLGAQDAKDGSFNVSSEGTVMDFAKTSIGTGKSEADNHTLDIALRLNTLNDKNNYILYEPGSKQALDHKGNYWQQIEFYRNKPEYSKYSKLNDKELYKVVIKELEKKKLADPEYINLLAEADKFGVNLDEAQKKVGQLSDKELLGSELGRKIEGLGNNLKFTVDVSENNKYNVDDQMFVSGFYTLTEDQLTSIMEDGEYSTDKEWYLLPKFLGGKGVGILKSDWQDIFVDKDGPGGGLITKNSDGTYSIPVKKKIGISDQMGAMYDKAMTGTAYNKPEIQEDLSKQREAYFKAKTSEYEINQGLKKFEGHSKEERIKNLVGVQQEFEEVKKSLDPEIQKELVEHWEAIFGKDGKKQYKDLKEKDTQIILLQKLLQQEKQQPGFIKNQINSSDIQEGGVMLEETVSIGNGGYELGDISAKHESGKNPSIVGNIEGDKGGYSYGAFQFASGSGVPEAFLKSDYGKKYAKMFEGKGSSKDGGEFKSTWEKVGRNNSEQFLKDQRSFALDSYLKPVKELGTSLGLNLDKRSMAISEILLHASMASTVVAKQVLKKVAGKINMSTATDSELLDAIFVEVTRSDSNGKGLAYWPSQTLEIQENVKATWKRQQKELKALMALEAQQNSSAT